MFTRSVVIFDVSSKYSYIQDARDQHCYECLLQWKSNKHYLFWVVSVALVIQKANCMRRNIICGLLSFTIFFPHYHINGKIFERKYYSTWKCVFLLLIFFNIPHSKKNWASYGQKCLPRKLHNEVVSLIYHYLCHIFTLYDIYIYIEL